MLALGCVFLIGLGRRLANRSRFAWVMAATGLAVMSAVFWARELESSFRTAPVAVAGVVMSAALAFGLLLGWFGRRERSA